MNRSIRTTLVYGLVSAVAVMPVAGMLSSYLGWPLAFKLVLWADLAGYALLLARWSDTALGGILFPLGLLLGTAVWPGAYHIFFYLGLGVLSWLRSGVCFTGTPLRAIAGETVGIAGGAGLVMLLNPGTTVTWAVSVWLFFLIQALYFFIVPSQHPNSGLPVMEDPFDQARRETQRVLDEAG